MDNFTDLLSLKNLKKYSFANKNNESDESVELLLQDVYFRIFKRGVELGYLDQLLEIQGRYLGSEWVVKLTKHDEIKISYEKNIIKRLYNESNVAMTTKNEKYSVLNNIISEVKKMLRNKVSKNNKERLFVKIYMFASVMSYISNTTVNLFKHNLKDVERENVYLGIENLIVDTIGVVYSEDSLWISNLLGTTKKNCEYLINMILNEEIAFTDNDLDATNLSDVFIYSELTIDYLLILKSINSLHNMSIDIGIKNGLLHYDESINFKFEKYFNEPIDDTLELDGLNVEILLKKFEDIEGYSPLAMEKYAMNLNDKFLYTDVAMNIVEDKLLYTDFITVTGENYDVIERLIGALSLAKCENIDNSIFSTGNRLYRTPIIKLDDCYILSNQLIIEAVHYLRYRILKKELSTSRDLNNMIKDLYDEFELQSLVELLDKHSLVGGVNFSIEKIAPLKKQVKESGISKEIDFYFVLDEVLYLAEFKNQDIDNSLFDICSSYSKNIKNKSKHLRMVELMNKNIPSVSEFLNLNIKSIRSFLVFKKKNSFTEFYEGNDIYCCSFSHFYEFCDVFFKKRNFESLCDGFLFFK